MMPEYLKKAEQEKQRMDFKELIKSKRTWTIVSMAAFEILQHFLGNR